MGRMRTMLLPLLVVGPALLAGVNPNVAASAPPDEPAIPPLVAAGESSCSCTVKCPCGCSPLAGAWVARLASGTDKIVQTFTFVPVNEECNKLAVNAQATTRSAQVARLWPDACDLTEFVGIACPGKWGDLAVTAIGYGIRRCANADRAGDAVVVDASKPAPKDKVVFIALLTARVEMPASNLNGAPTGTNDSATAAATTYDTSDGACKTPDELGMLVDVSYYDAAQDRNHDGFPDTCQAVLCLSYETWLKRVPMLAPCEVSKSFVACLEPCPGANTSATGRAFFRIVASQQKVWFVLSGTNLEGATGASIEINRTPTAAGTRVVTLLALPPDKGPKDTCDGLLRGGYFYPKDCVGPWMGRKSAEIASAMEEGHASVVIFIKNRPEGALCGAIEGPP